MMVPLGPSDALGKGMRATHPPEPPRLAAPVRVIGGRRGAVDCLFSSRRRHTILQGDWSSDVCSSDLSQALKSGYTAPSQGIEAAREAQQAVKNALKVGPHESRMWLALALLQARNNDADPLIAESLKMSYLTGPNRADLIP